MLAALFLIAVWLDDSQPAQAPGQTYAFLILYLLFSATIAVTTWRNWWLDARLAVPVHVIDMAAFAFICFSVSGYTSPFFLVFILPLMSAAIRWGWRETALTATALVLIFLAGGILVAGSHSFEMQRFVVRTGHLAILSAIIIWFGIHQRFVGLYLPLHEYDPLIGEGDPRELALRVTMHSVGAGKGSLLLRNASTGRMSGVCIESGATRLVEDVELMVRDPAFHSSFLFNTARDRALGKTPHSAARFARATSLFDEPAAARLELREGVAGRINSGTADGWLVLEGIANLSGDYVELGREFARAAGALLDRSALLSAVSEGAAARTRLGLARDVHDSIIQFIAGATFRVEAIARAARSGAAVDGELKELKELLVEEQRDIRGFVAALRRDSELPLADSVEELRALATRLGQHWAVRCIVEAGQGEAPIPIRLHLDLHHLLREAVANAVRHGGADRIDVSLDVAGDVLHVEVLDNGRGFAAASGNLPDQPRSLRERVERANGSLSLESKPGRTSIMISLPLNGAASA